MSARHRTLIVFGLLAASSTAGAQARRPSKPVRQPQIGGIAPSPSEARQARRDRDDRDDRHSRRDDDDRRGEGYGRRDGYAPPEGSYGWVPAVVGSDGRVWVNLGYGYEQVVRTCDVPFGGYSSGYMAAPSTGTSPGYAPPTYTTPTYPAPSQGAISQPLPDPTSQPVPDPNSHAVPGMPQVPGVAPVPGARGGAQYSYPPRDHRATASCFASGPQGRPAVLWH